LILLVVSGILERGIRPLRYLLLQHQHAADSNNEEVDQVLVGLVVIRQRRPWTC
jgi:hypothetical protein